LIQASRQLKGTIFWDEFLTSFSFLHELRDYSGMLRDRLPPDAGSSIEDSVEASELVQALVDPKAVADIESLLAQERETEALLKTHGA
jgi:hypothetical protein